MTPTDLELERVYSVHDELSSRVGIKNMNYDPDLLVVAVGVVIARHLGSISEELYHLRVELNNVERRLGEMQLKL